MKFPQLNIQKNSLAWLPAHGRFNAQSHSPFPPSRNARRNKYGPKIASKGAVIAVGSDNYGNPHYIA